VIRNPKKTPNAKMLNNSYLNDDWDVDRFKTASFMELALEGERRCKKGDCRAGVIFLEEAITKRDVVDKADARTLSAIYSQLGNAYFYLQDYSKAFEFHKLDLQVACRIKDKVGEAKASGNLGNTLKVLGRFEEAILCCERHLLLSKEMNDHVGEGRAFYNLGNVYHARGKQLGKDQVSPSDAGDFPPEVRDALTLATEYYRANLQIVLNLGDLAAQGRAHGNLGNTYHLLSKFEEAIECHKERQKIAVQLGDKAAERRALSNMGNGYIFLGDYEAAVEAYGQSLSVSMELVDVAMEAQAAFSLGNTFMLMKDYDKATEYLTRHLKIARDLNDKVGESRSLWCLSTALSALPADSIDLAIPYAQRHLEISKELGDVNGVEIAVQSLEDLKRRKRQRSSVSSSSTTTAASSSSSSTLKSASTGRGESDDYECNFDRQNLPDLPSKAKSKRLPRKASSIMGPTATTDQFFEYLSRVQGNRLDDQRCTVDTLASNGNSAVKGTLKSTSSLSSTSNNRVVNGTKTTISVEDQLLLDSLVGGGGDLSSSAPNKGRDELIDVEEKSHKSRSMDQRTATNRLVIGSNSDLKEDDFFSLITRIQSSRIEDQRSNMPRPVHKEYSSQPRNDVQFSFEQNNLDCESQSNRSTPVDGIFKRLPRLSKKKKNTRID